MADVTVSQFANVLKVPLEKLLSQLADAGITVDGGDDIISDDAKMKLLNHLRESHGIDESDKGKTAAKKITLKENHKLSLSSQDPKADPGPSM